MIISILLSIGSIILGLIAWIIPVISMRNSSSQGLKKCSYLIIASFTSCIISLCLQFFEILYRVQISDWAALMDTIGVLAGVALILGISTIILNIIALVVCLKKERQIE